MAEYRHKAEYNDGKHKIVTHLFLLEFKEGDNFIIYSPALDLSGYGKSEAEAKKSFNVALEEFSKYTNPPLIGFLNINVKLLASRP